MFNIENRSQLSDFSQFFDELVRDSDFFSVGKIPSRLSARTVPISAKRFFSEFERERAGISAVICPPDLQHLVPADLGCAVTDDPVLSAVLIHDELCKKSNYFWSSFSSRISPSARIHKTASIAESDVVIGEDTEIGPCAVVHERSIIGARCRIGAGTVIGSDAFEMSNVAGKNRLQSQGGGVLLGNDVIIFSNSVIVRSIYPLFTEIGDRCMIDNLVHIAHDCFLEPDCKVVACSMIAGRVDLASGSYVGPNSSISNGLSVGKNATITIGSTVVRNVREGSRVTGNFAIDHSQFIRNLKLSVK
jgi:UDP-3-O-[3-hydroxymyristoyl] glucosamine N-acyltransferase